MVAGVAPTPDGLGGRDLVEVAARASGAGETLPLQTQGGSDKTQRRQAMLGVAYNIYLL